VRRKNGPFLRRRDGVSLENEITAWPPTDGPLGTCLEPLGTERVEKAPEGWSATPPALFLQVRSGFCIRLGPRLVGFGKDLPERSRGVSFPCSMGFVSE